MRVKYVITQEIQDEVKSLLKQTRSLVAKERLIAVSLYVCNGMSMKDIAKYYHIIKHNSYSPQV